MHDCWQPNLSENQLTFGLIMLVSALGALFFYLFLLESIYVFARRRVAVMLLLSHSFAELFMLAQFVWLSIEIVLNHRVRLPWHLDSFLYKLANNAEQAHLLLIALNRAHCIYSPTHYKALWSQRNAVIACLCAWLYGAGISLFLNYGLEKPEEAYLIHCVARFTFDRIRTNETAELAHEWVGRYSTIVLVFLPLAIYCIFLLQIACECLCPAEFAYVLHQKTRKFTGNVKLSDEVNTLGDRIRLLLICLLSTLPDAVVWIAMALMGKDHEVKKFAQSMLIILMHCNQPIWLILLSETFRIHLRREIRNSMKAIQGLLCCVNLSNGNTNNNAPTNEHYNRRSKRFRRKQWMDANGNQLRIESRTETTTDGRRGSSQPISTVFMAECDDAGACDGTAMESGHISMPKSDGNVLNQEDGITENGLVNH